MEDDPNLILNLEWRHQKNWKTSSKNWMTISKENENGRRPQFIFENLKWWTHKNGRQPSKKKWKKTSTKSNGGRPQKKLKWKTT
jgi:hypothetical protein